MRLTKIDRLTDIIGVRLIMDDWAQHNARSLEALLS